MASTIVAPGTANAAAVASPIDTLCMACDDAGCDFKPTRMQRRALGPNDVLIDMKYCGVCHSDLHKAANHMASVGRPTVYPCVPGHELAGICTAVGSAVTKIRVGDQVGVGCLVDSCHECEHCLRGEEQKCKKSVGTYQSRDWSGRAASVPAGMPTVGGYTSKIVVHERFAIKIPSTYPLAMAGPILCAGITMFDPLMAHGATTGTRVGIVGLGGLGVMGVKLAKALGCVVTAVSRSPSKRDHAIATCGADHFIASTDKAAMRAAAGSIDLVLNTIPAMHDYTVYEALVSPLGKHVTLGANAVAGGAIYAAKIVGEAKMRTVFSAIGGIKNTQAVVDLCDKAKIYPETKVMPVSALSEIYEALDSNNDAGIRYVLDIGTTLTEDAFTVCTAPPPKMQPNTTGFSYGRIVFEVLRMVGGSLCRASQSKAHPAS